jgi:hypothetical protein
MTPASLATALCLAGARDTNRFLDKRTADLEAELLAAPRGRQEAP